MNRWQDSLIRIASHDIAELRTRLAEVIERRACAELRLATFEAEADAEIVHAYSNAQAAWYGARFLAAVRTRRGDLKGELRKLTAEEAGARDALAEAFEALKRFEHVVELTRTAAVKSEARREAAIHDDLALRKRAR